MCAREDIAREFGAEIAGIVDGLTKISSLTFRSSAEEQVENYRKLLLSIAKDARVIIIKLADRLHNMRTLEHLPPERRSRIALETREIYAPLAHRFGMAGIKAELEDLAFKFLEPDDYRDLATQVAAKRAEREQTIAQARDAARLRAQARRHRVVRGHRPAQASLVDLPEDAASATRRSTRSTISWPSASSCARCPSAITCSASSTTTGRRSRSGSRTTSPAQVERAISRCTPPSSGPGGQLFEVQIRTQEMHRTAEYGIAAHWLYKRDGKTDELDQHLGWFRQLLELQQDTHSPEEFLEFLKIDLYQDEIFVFTPQGDVKRLPKGSTAIDFAFHVHTEVGLKCQGAKINGRIAPLHRELKSGDTVEILTGAGRQAEPRLAQPRPDRARPAQDQAVGQPRGRDGQPQRSARRSWPARFEAPPARGARRHSARQGGRHALAGRWTRTRDRRGPGRRARSARSCGRCIRISPREDIQEPKPTVFGRVIDRIRLGRGIKIQGVDGLMVRYAQCCQPVPGDSVVGYVTQGRGISIHRADCPNLLTLWPTTNGGWTSIGRRRRARRSRCGWR